MGTRITTFAKAQESPLLEPNFTFHDFLPYTRKMMNEKSETVAPNSPKPASDATMKQARALGDPTRYRIFRYIEQAKRPTFIDELTEFIGVNHNAVRQHLSVLKDAELVEEQVENRSRPGRPRLQYSIGSGVPGTWGTEGPYETVAVLMAEIIKTRRSPRQVGQEAGRKRLRGYKERPTDLVELLTESLSRDGFDPHSIQKADSWDIVLERCPFAKVASVDPSTVCQLHLGMLEGLIDELDTNTDLHLSIRDPKRAGCRVWVKAG